MPDRSPTLGFSLHNIAIPDQAIGLYDEEGNWLEPLGCTATNRSGYFRIDSHNLGGYAEHSVYIHVLDSLGTHVYADKNPLKPKGGTDDYRQISLGKGAEVDIPAVQNGTHPLADADRWLVRGCVSDQTGKGIGGLIVQVSDKDSVLGDRFGQAETDEAGCYILAYRTEDFRDLMEQDIDLQLKVLDEGGKTMFTSVDPFRFEAGRAQIVNFCG